VKKFSVSDIASQFKCYQGKIDYWLSKFKIQKRSISDVLYEKLNPKGDPFSVQIPQTITEVILYKIGVGLYWVEGTKSNRGSVRLGNTDPRMIKKFIEFLTSFYQIDKKRLRFGLQVFGDMNAEVAVRFWVRSLGITRKQFHKTIIVTPHRGIGNYCKKTEHGVATLYFNNRKLRDIICRAIDDQSIVLK
jgi:hypothetical protein